MLKKKSHGNQSLVTIRENVVGNEWKLNSYKNSYILKQNLN